MEKLSLAGGSVGKLTFRPMEFPRRLEDKLGPIRGEMKIPTPSLDKTEGQGWVPSMVEIWTVRYFSCFSIAAVTSCESGVTAGSKRCTTLPSRSTKNLVKFHLISPVMPGSVSLVR